jgi:hypothetical protein
LIVAELSTYDWLGGGGGGTGIGAAPSATKTPLPGICEAGSCVFEVHGDNIANKPRNARPKLSGLREFIMPPKAESG